jgi:hypothetical protein
VLRSELGRHQESSSSLFAESSYDELTDSGLGQIAWYGPPRTSWSGGPSSPVLSPSPSMTESSAAAAAAEEEGGVTQQFLVNLINLSKLNLDSS